MHTSDNAHVFSDKTTPALECRAISKHYGRGGWFSTAGHQVLNTVSLRLEHGESLGLVGLNGSGKSTLIRLLLGLETPDTGEVLLFGKPLDWHRQADPQAWRRHIQVVFQDSRQAVNPRFSVEEIVCEPLRAQGMKRCDRRELCAELLMDVGLVPDFLSRRPVQLSGGQLQRVCIARALSLNPKILLLDESVSDLDLLAQARILELLDCLRQERGMALLFVSHDMRAVFQLCRRALVLDHGELVGCLGSGEGEALPAQETMAFTLWE